MIPPSTCPYWQADQPGPTPAIRGEPPPPVTPPSGTRSFKYLPNCQGTMVSIAGTWLDRNGWRRGPLDCATDGQGGHRPISVRHRPGRMDRERHVEAIERDAAIAAAVDVEDYRHVAHALGRPRGQRGGRRHEARTHDAATAVLEIVAGKVFSIGASARPIMMEAAIMAPTGRDRSEPRRQDLAGARETCLSIDIRDATGCETNYPCTSARDGGPGRGAGPVVLADASS
jgi:hypothetical protein